MRDDLSVAWPRTHICRDIYEGQKDSWRGRGVSGETRAFAAGSPAASGGRGWVLVGGGTTGTARMALIKIKATPWAVPWRRGREREMWWWPVGESLCLQERVLWREVKALQLQPPRRPSIECAVVAAHGAT